MILLNPKKPISFIPESERKLKADEQSVFHLAPLTVEQENTVKDSLFLGGAVTPHRQYDAAFRASVVSIDNLYDASGTKVEYKNTEEIVSMIPRHIRDEVGLHVIKMLDRGTEEAKN